MSNIIEDRDIRQRELIPPERLSHTRALVAGVGAVGRQVAIQLAALGIPKMLIVDFDHVAPENLAPQGFFETDLGRPKVDAVADLCKQINSSIRVETANQKFKSFQFSGGVFFCCVDGIETRKSIFNTVNNRADLFLDSRMAAEYVRVISAYDEKSRENYKTTLFSGAEAYQAACTSKSTIYCANIAAGLLVSQFAKWLRGCDLDMDIDLNLLTNEMGAK